MGRGGKQCRSLESDALWKAGCYSIKRVIPEGNGLYVRTALPKPDREQARPTNIFPACFFFLLYCRTF